MIGMFAAWLAVAAPASYIGSGKCIACHRQRDAAIVEGWLGSAHRQTMTVPGPKDRASEDRRRPGGAKQEEVRAIIGRTGGEYVTVGREFGVTAAGSWKRKDAVSPHDVIGAAGQTVDASRQCLGCHSTGYSVLQAAYAEAGVACEACHGPGGTHAKSPGTKGSIVHPGKLPAERGNMVCGQCHSTGKDPSGQHPFPVMGSGKEARAFLPGEDLALGFIDSKPKLVRKGWEYSLLAQSSEHYSNQRCTACHDPHGKGKSHAMLRDPTSETCLRCHGEGDARLRFENHWGLGDATKRPCWECHRNAHSH